MANDYIPRPPTQLHARQDNFVTYANDHPADLRLEPALGVKSPAGSM